MGLDELLQSGPQANTGLDALLSSGVSAGAKIAGMRVVAAKSEAAVHYGTHHGPGVYDVTETDARRTYGSMDKAAAKLAGLGYVVAVRRKGQRNILSNHLHFADPEIADPKEVTRLQKQGALQKQMERIASNKSGQSIKSQFIPAAGELTSETVARALMLPYRLGKAAIGLLAPGQPQPRPKPQAQADPMAVVRRIMEREMGPTIPQMIYKGLTGKEAPGLAPEALVKAIGRTAGGFAQFPMQAASTLERVVLEGRPAYPKKYPGPGKQNYQRVKKFQDQIRHTVENVLPESIRESVREFIEPAMVPFTNKQLRTLAPDTLKAIGEGLVTVRQQIENGDMTPFLSSVAMLIPAIHGAKTGVKAIGKRMAPKALPELLAPRVEPRPAVIPPDEIRALLAVEPVRETNVGYETHDVPIAALRNDPTVQQRLKGKTTTPRRVEEITSADIRTPAEATVDKQGNLYVTDGSHRIAAAIQRGDNTYSVRISPAESGAKYVPTPEPAPIPAVTETPAAAKSPAMMTREEFTNAFEYHANEKGLAFIGRTGQHDLYTSPTWEGIRQFENLKVNRTGVSRDAIYLLRKSDLSSLEQRASDQTVPGANAYKHPKSVPVTAELPTGLPDPHKYLVDQALSRGEPVYEGWQADYPDLAAKYAPTPAQPTPAAGAEGGARTGEAVAKTANDQYSQLSRQMDDLGEQIEKEFDREPLNHATVEALSQQHDNLSAQRDFVGQELQAHEQTYSRAGVNATLTEPRPRLRSDLDKLFGKQPYQSPSGERVMNSKTGAPIDGPQKTYDTEQVRDALAEIASEPWSFGQPPENMKEFGPWLSDILSGQKETQFISRLGTKRVFGEPTDAWTSTEINKLKEMLRDNYDAAIQGVPELPVVDLSQVQVPWPEKVVRPAEKPRQLLITALQDKLQRGESVLLPSHGKLTKYTSPDHFRLSPDETGLQVREGKSWVWVGQQGEAKLARQVGLDSVFPEGKPTATTPAEPLVPVTPKLASTGPELALSGEQAPAKIKPNSLSDITGDPERLATALRNNYQYFERYLGKDAAEQMTVRDAIVKLLFEPSRGLTSEAKKGLTTEARFVAKSLGAVLKGRNITSDTSPMWKLKLKEAGDWLREQQQQRSNLPTSALFEETKGKQGVLSEAEYMGTEKPTPSKYVVVDKKTRKTVAEVDTEQEAWNAWQAARNAAGGGLDSAEQFTFGLRRSMKKYLQPETKSRLSSPLARNIERHLQSGKPVLQRYLEEFPELAAKYGKSQMAAAEAQGQSLAARAGAGNVAGKPVPPSKVPEGYELIDEVLSKDGKVRYSLQKQRNGKYGIYEASRVTNKSYASYGRPDHSAYAENFTEPEIRPKWDALKGQHASASPPAQPTSGGEVRQTAAAMVAGEPIEPGWTGKAEVTAITKKYKEHGAWRSWSGDIVALTPRAPKQFAGSAPYKALISDMQKLGYAVQFEPRRIVFKSAEARSATIVPRTGLEGFYLEAYAGPGRRGYIGEAAGTSAEGFPIPGGPRTFRTEAEARQYAKEHGYELPPAATPLSSTAPQASPTGGRVAAQEAQGQSLAARTATDLGELRANLSVLVEQMNNAGEEARMVGGMVPSGSATKFEQQSGRDIVTLLEKKSGLSTFDQTSGTFLAVEPIDAKSFRLTGGWGSVQTNMGKWLKEQGFKVTKDNEGGLTISFDVRKAPTPAPGEPPTSGGEGAPATAKRATAKLDEIEASIKERIAKRPKTIKMGVDPTEMADYVALGAVKIAKGAVKFSDWSAQMITEFGQKIRPYLRKIWKRAKIHLKEEIEPQYNVVAKVRKAMLNAKVDLQTLKEQQSQARSQNAAILHSIRKRHAGKGQDITTRSLGALKGELAPRVFKPIRDQFTKTEVNDIHNIIHETPRIHEKDIFERTALADAFDKLLDGRLPNESTLNLFDRVFGQEFTDSILKKLPIKAKLKRLWWGLYEIPRTTLFTADVSWPGRQGKRLGFGYPKEYLESWKQGVKSLVSEANLERLEQEIRDHPGYEDLRKAGVKLSNRGRFTTGDEINQYYQALPLLSRIPGIGHIIKGSNQAWEGAGDALRSAVFYKWREGQGGKPNPKDMSAIADAINHLTGTGDVPGFERSMAALSRIFTAPRYTASLIQGPLSLVSKRPAARKMAARALTAYTASMLGLLGLLRLRGASVDTDATSTEFGKARFGNTRIDLGVGDIQVVRLAARMLTGKRSGTKIDTGREAMRWLGYRIHPSARLINQARTGKNWLGQEATTEDWTWGNAPVSVQDIRDAIITEDSLPWWQIAPFAFSGTPVMIYKDKPKSTRPWRPSGASDIYSRPSGSGADIYAIPK